MAEKSDAKSKSENKKNGKSAGSSNNPAELRSQLDRTEVKLHQTEMLLSVTQKIAGLKNLSEILHRSTAW